MRRLTCSALISILTLCGAAQAQVPVDTGWTYQGKLTDGGTPATGSYDLRFSLFLDDQGTIPTGPVLDALNTSVNAGLFTTVLDFGAQFTGYKNWLLIEVSPAGAGTYTALPLQEITSSPQSIFSQVSQFTQGFAVPFSGSGDAPAPDAVFKMSNTNANDGAGLWGEAAGNTGVGVVGNATAATGNAYGGQFFSSSADGRGLLGQATSTTGLAIGGRFTTASTGGRGVWSTALASTGATYGVIGESFSTTGIGILGYAPGGTYGVHGICDSINGVGVQGVNNSTSASGNPYGGAFSSAAPNGRGVLGNATATTGLAIGGRFVTASVDGRAVWGSASAGSGVTVGVFGTSASAAGYGGYFQNLAVGGTALWADGLCKVKTLQILGGADLAEPFDVAASAAGNIAEPGMVVVIDAANPGDLRLADKPYDGKVAGVISGANGLAPGMVMSAQGQDKADGKHPVAMTGRVWVYVDASFGAVEPGDILTTSATPGHAMLASDHARAFGSVIGKAMTELKDGKGLVLVLVNLQ